MKNEVICLYCNRKDEKGKMIDNATINDGFSLFYHEDCLDELKDKTGQ